jgi:hypothetical protein
MYQRVWTVAWLPRWAKARETTMTKTMVHFDLRGRAGTDTIPALHNLCEALGGALCEISFVKDELKVRELLITRPELGDLIEAFTACRDVLTSNARLWVGPPHLEAVYKRDAELKVTITPAMTSANGNLLAGYRLLVDQLWESGQTNSAISLYLDKPNG